MVQRSNVTRGGAAVIIIGVFLAVFTFGVGLIVSVIGLLIRNRYTVCRSCGWTPEH